MVKNRIKYTPGSILGSLIFNKNILEMLFKQQDVKFTVTADDHTPYFSYIKVLIDKLQLIILERLSNN